MAVVRNADASRLMVRVQTGVSSTGKPVLKNRTFAGVKAAAADEAVYEVAGALAGLQLHPLDAVLREDNGTLAEA